MAAKALTGRERCEQADQANMQIRAVLDLASLHATSGLEKPHENFVEDFIDHLLDDSYKVHPTLEALRAIALKLDKDDFGDDFGFQLYHRDMLGIVLLVVTPVMTKNSKTSWSFSWGYTQSTYVYAESYNEAWKLGIAWAEQCRKEAKPAPKKRKSEAARASV